MAMRKIYNLLIILLKLFRENIVEGKFNLKKLS